MYLRLNDQVIDSEQARVSVFDRGFMYGDGVFETMRSYHRTVFRLDAHLQRLMNSATSLAIRVPYNSDETTSHITHLLDANSLEDAVVRISVTRGIGSRGPSVDPSAKPTYLITTEPLPLSLHSREEHGISLATVRRRRTPDNVLPSSAKHANYLNAILANMEAASNGADEALMLSTQGHLAECATGNVFVVIRNRILTPSLTTGILPGITRAAILELASVHEDTLLPEILLQADEVFMTNSLFGILPARRVDGREFPVDGTVVSQLRKDYQELIERW